MYFEQAYLKTMGNEVGYTNDPLDKGGETYDGIARKYDTTWAGWILIDNFKKDNPNFRPSDIDSAFKNDSTMQYHKKQFYKTKYWDIFKGDNIKYPLLAEKLFDISVNMGTGRACKFLQEGINILNRNGNVQPDIAVDGIVGAGTLTALNILMSQSDKEEGYMVKLLSMLQGNVYVESCRKDPTQRRFIRGWLNRI